MYGYKQQWYVPSERPLLSRDDVHIWRASLDVSATSIDILQRTLTEDEALRAQRLYFRRDRDHYIVARGILRTLLGMYLNQQPSQLRFQYNAHGKPLLQPIPERQSIQFNVSHSHGVALYALAYERAVGIDIERIRNDIAYDAIAERFFAPQESVGLLRIPEVVRLEAFFACWTRKEAYVKARGDGLSCPLDQFVVSVAPGEPARLISHQGDPNEASCWSLVHIEPGYGAVGALAINGAASRIVQWQWQDRAIYSVAHNA